MAGMGLTVEEAYPSRDRSLLWARAVCLLLFAAIAFPCMGIGAFHRPPPYPPVRHLPWQLALFISWAFNMCLALLIFCYIHLFLPLTPVAVETSFRHVGAYFNMGFLGVMVFSSVIVINDVRYTIACTCINAIFLAGLLVFWRWLASKYRQVDLP